jgi:phosphoglycolate phosphatase-like HAD superfamily hydrolase
MENEIIKTQTQIKVVVFDFDGVLINSNVVKEAAWGEILPWPLAQKIKPIIKRTTQAEGAGSRFDILIQLFRGWGRPKRILDVLVNHYANRYNEYVQVRLAKMGLVPGVERMLLELGKKYALYVNSSTPDDALQTTFKTLGISHFFKGVYGRRVSGIDFDQNSKLNNLKRAENNENASPSEVVMVGDGEGDRVAAEEFECHFIGILSGFADWEEGRESFPLTNDVLMVPSIIDKISKAPQVLRGREEPNEIVA